MRLNSGFALESAEVLLKLPVLSPIPDQFNQSFLVQGLGIVGAKLPR